MTEPDDLDLQIKVDTSEFEARMSEFSEAFTALGERLADMWAPVAQMFVDVFAPIYAITPDTGPWAGREGEPIAAAADAAGAAALAGIPVKQFVGT